METRHAWNQTKPCREVVASWAGTVGGKAAFANLWKKGPCLMTLSLPLCVRRQRRPAHRPVSWNPRVTKSYEAQVCSILHVHTRHSTLLIRPALKLAWQPLPLPWKYFAPKKRITANKRNGITDPDWYGWLSTGTFQWLSAQPRLIITT